MSVATEIERLQNAKADIKTAIEEKGVTVGDGTIDTYADKVREISVDSGDGYAQGYNDGIEQGKQDEYRRFWDTYCNNGTYYGSFWYHFAGLGWDDETFNPPQTIRVKGASDSMFRYSGISKLLANQVDFTEATQLLNTFNMTNVSSSNKKLTYIELLNLPKCTKLENTFLNNSFLESLTITNLRENCTFGSTFANCSSLADLSVTGVIGTNINLSSSPLSKASIMNVMTVLSTTTSGRTVTFKKTAVNTAFETAEGLADGSTSQEWLDLIATKSNWTISLV